MPCSLAALPGACPGEVASYPGFIETLLLIFNPESNLGTHDIAFGVEDNANQDSIYRAILISGKEGWASQRGKVDKLRMLSGGRLIAVIFLVNGDKAVASFAQMQCE